MAATRPSFFDDFNLARYPAGATVLFFTLLAAGNEVADWSSLVSDWRDMIKVQSGAIFKVYLGWMVVWLIVELWRLKLRHDLAMLRYEKGKRGKRQR